MAENQKKHQNSEYGFLASFFQRLAPEGFQMGASNHHKIVKICKENAVEAHSLSRYIKKLSLEGAKPLKKVTVSQFYLFFQRSEVSKKAKLLAKMEPRGT